MKNFKFNLAIVGLLTMLFISIIVTSCTKEVVDSNVQIEPIEQEHSATQGEGATVRSSCHHLFTELGLGGPLPFANNECMNNAHTRLQAAIANYNANSSDYNLYLVFNFWLNYYRTAVDCFGCEATDCESYVADGEQMVQCLIDCGSPYATALQDIYSWVQGNCQECCGDCDGDEIPECCEDAELVYEGVTQKWLPSSLKFCCFYEYSIVGDCGPGFNQVEIEGFGGPIDYDPNTHSLYEPVCDGGQRLRFTDTHCGLSTPWLDDNCNDECCINVSFEVEQTIVPNSPDCCNVLVHFNDPDGCTNGWEFLQIEGENDVTPILPQSSSVFPIQLCGDTRVRVINESCGVDTNWIGRDCN